METGNDIFSMLLSKSSEDFFEIANWLFSFTIISILIIGTLLIIINIICLFFEDYYVYNQVFLIRKKKNKLKFTILQLKD